MSESPVDIAKANAARASADFVKSGMIVGLGTGSTAVHLVRELGRRAAQGLKFHGVPTSEATLNLAQSVGLTMIEANNAPRIDLTIDGADEVDSAFRLIKGAGGALLREKIIAAASRDYVIIADASKRVDTLGTIYPLPVEVTPFAYSLTMARIREAMQDAKCAGKDIALRNKPDGGVFVTDGGNYILDCHCQRIPNAEPLAAALKAIPGMVEHGLFLGMAKTLIIGTANGAEIIKR